MPKPNNRRWIPLVGGSLLRLGTAILIAGMLLGSWGSAILIAHAQTAYFSFSADPVVVAACGTQTVDVVLNDVVDAEGAEFRMSFDAAVLEVVDALPQAGVQIQPRDDLFNVTGGFIVRNVVDNAAGTIWFAFTQLGDENPPVTGDGAIARITFRAKSAGTSLLDFTAVDLADIDGNPIGVTSLDGSATTTAPSAPGSATISRLNATTARLTWGSVAGVANYTLYRAVTPYFTPAPTDVLLTTTSLSYDDVGILGDVNVQHYYVVRANCANGFQGELSQRLGEYDWALRSAATANYNDISRVFNDSTITTAAQLATYIGPSVTSIFGYDAVTHATRQYMVGMPFTNFTLYTGGFLFVVTNTTAPVSFPMVGVVPAQGSVAFNLVSGDPARSNYVSLPLDQAALDSAIDVYNDVGSSVVRIYKYNAVLQQYREFTPGQPFTDFALVLAEPFILRLTTGAPTVWP